ncbi:MAG: MFS transporter [Actinomycetota bacterium]|nr:MFS transporter [Actinomycetota bacterium]
MWWLLRGNPSFRTLWIARTVSFLGDSLSLVALMLYVADTTGEALAVALLLLVGDFAPSLLGPFTGTVSDRWDLKRVMVACELAQGGLVAVIALTLPSLPLLLTLVAVRAVAGQIFQPASRAAVPALVPDRDLGSANSALGFGTNGSEALGPLLAAALFPLLDVRGVLLVDAATFLVSAVVLARLPRLPPAAVGPEGRVSFLADVRAGLGYLGSVPAVRVIALGFCAVVAFNGVDDVALVFLATDSLGGGQSAVALLLAAVGIGLLVGYLLLARGAGRLPMVAAFLVGLGVSSAGNLLSGLAWAVGVAFVLQAVRGVGIAAMDVGATTLLQRLVPPAMLGRVFGNLYGAIGVAAALSYLLGGFLLDLTSPRVTLVAAGAGGLLATLATAVVLRQRRRRPGLGEGSIGGGR